MTHEKPQWVQWWENEHSPSVWRTWASAALCHKGGECPWAIYTSCLPQHLFVVLVDGVSMLMLSSQGHCMRSVTEGIWVLFMCGMLGPFHCLLLSWVQYSSFQTQPRELREVKYIVQATSYYNKQDLNPGWQTESLGLFQYTLQHIKGPACSNEPQILATALWYWKPKSAPKSVVLFDLSCFSNWQVYIDHIFNVLWIGQQRTVVLMGSDYVFLCYIQ